MELAAECFVAIERLLAVRDFSKDITWKNINFGILIREL